MHVVGISLLVLVWTLGLIAEVVGSVGGWACPLFPIPLQSFNSLLPLHIYPAPLSAHTLLVTPISLSVSYHGTLRLYLGIGDGQISPYINPAELAVRLVVLKRWG